MSDFDAVVRGADAMCRIASSAGAGLVCSVGSLLNWQPEAARRLMIDATHVKAHRIASSLV